ncbi:ABC transporter ATP-binding protein [Brachybacterium sp. YJGR34]|uniref:ABC transporter ATP-binding protein n=1 Tax=Brachybacterium sp. YJGR34 TaxID=2059911 RepID=UPI000E0B9575|nr:ABC transporter ATP-binding protein [Brachybacterium sp. YJGR34]
MPSDVTIRNLGVGYGEHEVLSLDELTVDPGEFLSILGPSGCGKTTLLNAIGGFVQPSRGTITVGGRDITALPSHRRGLGVVFQNYALFPHLSVAGNVGYGLRVRGDDRARRESRVAEMLELVGLSAYADRRPNQLSGGQQQRVALARGLAISPDVLLLDEPLSNLDAQLRRQMRVELREIQEALGTTMIFVTHDQDEALSMSDRVALFHDGRQEQIGTPEEIYRRPRTRFVADFMGAANLLRGTVVDDSLIDVEGEHLPVRTARRPGTTVDVALRREQIILDADPAAGPPVGVRGTVHMRSFSGSHWEFVLTTTKGVRLTAEVPDRPGSDWSAPEVGREVGISWRQDVPHVLEAVSP